MDTILGFAQSLLPATLISISTRWRHYAFFSVLTVLVWAGIIWSGFNSQCTGGCAAEVAALPMVILGLVASAGAMALKPLSLMRADREAQQTAEGEGS
ncbi:MAG: hypothetical protein BGO83_10145 [Devosia sp. 66-14]|nr:MAG: hypothetical protein ABS47_02460 [Devosia sp. SCN 66-27]OJX25223.1 MAG: hypothetical protein BGO83_10145 [Devosia sp. 66-14]